METGRKRQLKVRGYHNIKKQNNVVSLIYLECFIGSHCANQIPPRVCIIIFLIFVHYCALDLYLSLMFVSTMIVCAVRDKMHHPALRLLLMHCENDTFVDLRKKNVIEGRTSLLRNQN